MVRAFVRNTAFVRRIVRYGLIPLTICKNLLKVCKRICKIFMHLYSLLFTNGLFVGTPACLTHICWQFCCQKAFLLPFLLAVYLFVGTFVTPPLIRFIFIIFLLISALVLLQVDFIICQIRKSPCALQNLFRGSVHNFVYTNPLRPLYDM